MVFVRKKFFPAGLVTWLWLLHLVSPSLLSSDYPNSIADNNVGSEDTVDVELPKTEALASGNITSYFELNETVTEMDLLLREGVENSTVGVILDYPDGSTSNGTLVAEESTEHSIPLGTESFSVDGIENQTEQSTEHLLSLETESLSIAEVENQTELWSSHDLLVTTTEETFPAMAISGDNSVNCSDPNARETPYYKLICGETPNPPDPLISDNTSSKPSDFAKPYGLVNSSLFIQNETQISNSTYFGIAPYDKLTEFRYSLNSDPLGANYSTTDLPVQPRMKFSPVEIPVRTISANIPRNDSNSKPPIPMNMFRGMPRGLPTDPARENSPSNDSTTLDLSVSPRKPMPRERISLRTLPVPSSDSADEPMESTTKTSSIALLSGPVAQPRFRKMSPDTETLTTATTTTTTTTTTSKPTQGKTKNAKRFRSMGVATKPKKKPTKPPRKQLAAGTSKTSLSSKSRGVFRSVGGRKNGTRKAQAGTKKRKTTKSVVLRKHHRTTKLFRKAPKTDTDSMWEVTKILTEYL